MTIDPSILEAVATATDELDVEVYDVEWAGRILRVSLDRTGGVDLETLTTANRRIGAALDLADTISGAYQLEVGSPGLERPLRTTAHWEAARGLQVKIKTRPDATGNRRLEGVVESVSDEIASVRRDDGEVVQVDIGDVERARTVFVWGPAPKPGGPKSAAAKADSAKSGSAKAGRAKAGSAKAGSTKPGGSKAGTKHGTKQAGSSEPDTTMSSSEPQDASASASPERTQPTGERA